MTSSVPTPPAPESQAAATGATRGFRIRPKAILAVVIIAATVWFVLVNSQRASIKLWVHTVSAPVWIVLLCTFAAGMILGFLLRRRRRYR
jgi:uncharacterized integral membrane protein